MFIFRLLLLGLLLLPAMKLGADVTTADGVVIVPDRADASAAATVEALRRLDRQLANLFRFHAHRSPIQCRVVLSDRIAPGAVELQFRGNAWEAVFNDRDGSWLESFPLRRRLIGFLLLAKAGGPQPKNPDFLPGWLVSGIDARLKAAAGPELYLRNNRQLPLLRALLTEGRFPRFREQVANAPDRFPPAARRWLEELSRVMLDLAALQSSPVDNALGDYVLLSARGDATADQAFDATVGRLFLSAAETLPISERRNPETWKSLSSDERIQLALEHFAGRLAWHEYAPRPAQTIRKEFAQIEIFRLPRLDRMGNPVEGEDESRIEDVPALLHSRPDHAELRKRLGEALRAMNYGLSPELRAPLARLHEEINALPGPDAPEPLPPPTAFQTALNEFRAALDLYGKREDFLDDFDRRHRSPFEFYRARIEAAGTPDAMLTGPVRELLENTSRNYLGD